MLYYISRISPSKGKFFMDVHLTSSAIKKIAKILKNENKRALRLSVIGGKCSGFAYQYDLVDEIKEDDFCFQEDNACLVIDPISFPFLQGAEIDFISDFMNENFQIKNPNAVSSCGCGSSFSI